MAYLRKRKGRWYLVEKRRDPKTGKWREVSLGPCGGGRDGTGRGIALNVASKYAERRRLRKHGILEPAKCTLTLGQLRDKDLEDARQRGVVLYHRESCWRNILTHLPEDRRLEDITAEDIERMTVAMLRTARPQTVENYRTVLRKALKLATEVAGLRPDFPGLRKKLRVTDRRVAIALPVAQVTELIYRALERYPRIAQAVELMLLTGSRVSEILALTPKSIHDGCVHFPSHKRGLPRAFRVEGRLEALLQELPPRWSKRDWRALRDELGLSGLHRHDLRHTAATEAFRRGATVYDVQRLLGHRSPEMAQRIYTHLFPEPVPVVEFLSTPAPAVPATDVAPLVLVGDRHAALATDVVVQGPDLFPHGSPISRDEGTTEAHPARASS